ncbi:p7K [Jasmine virus H]|uniref:Putative movement protein 1 n=1 Tax=Jasmine virus H TaxID=1960887 RepID=A0A2I2MP93_9TOMB|nr:p7K [Jasmine virus H]AQS23736.1 p7K [Jasmine virus H]QAA12650.1 putative movement protein 1 [Jasmine virus H]QAA12665.1 putative movement protein 1 [Jasmine virus H]
MDIATTDKPIVKPNEKQAKRGKTKNRLDVAHSGVAKSTSSDIVGANFITVADHVTFTVSLHF